MHCRFYQDHLVNAYENICNLTTALTRPLAMVKESLQYMNQPIQLLGNVIDRGTTKFSVKGMDSYSIVHISFYLGKCMTTCLDGICSTLYKTHKKIPKRISISNKSKCCSHLNTMYDNIEYVRSFFPHYFEENTNEVNGNPVLPPQEEVNNEDENINVCESGNFNKEKGLWNFRSLSKHIPFDNMMDPGLIFATQNRNDIVTSANINMDTGLYEYLHLKPCIDGKVCNCGEAYVKEMYVGSCTLYSRMGPIQCKYYNYQCMSQVCTLSYEEAAREKGIFFYTTETAAGDEIGHDFIALVKKSKISFTGFCNEMTR